MSEPFFPVTKLIIVAPAFFLDSVVYELVTRFAASGVGTVSPD
jgi:hypothetical protein